MGRFYIYDMSEYLGSAKGWEIPEDGLYECIDFKSYLETADAFPFLIQYGDELAGYYRKRTPKSPARHLRGLLVT